MEVHIGKSFLVPAGLITRLQRTQNVVKIIISNDTEGFVFYNEEGGVVEQGTSRNQFIRTVNFIRDL